MADFFFSIFLLALTFMVAFTITGAISRIIRWVVVALRPGDRMLAARWSFAGTLALLIALYGRYR